MPSVVKTISSVALALCCMAGCGTPRERDCRVLLPRLDEAEAATSLLGNAQPNLANAFQMQATRSAAAARWLESATLSTEEVKRDVPALVAALGRHAELARSIDGSVRVLGFQPVDGGLTPGPALARLLIPESRERSPIFDDVVTLNTRCGFFLAEPNAEHVECKQLAAVLAHFMAPVDDVIRASAHLADCLNELASVHSSSPATERSIRSFEAIAREAATLAVAAIVDGPAVRLIVELRTISKASAAQRAAQADVARLTAGMRSACGGSAGAAAGPK